jgi:hypothetical protein
MCPCSMRGILQGYGEWGDRSWLPWGQRGKGGDAYEGSSWMSRRWWKDKHQDYTYQKESTMMVMTPSTPFTHSCLSVKDY